MHYLCTMKKVYLNFLIVTLSAIIATSCSRTYHYPDKLTVADSLCNVRPDSAFSMLKGMKSEAATLDEDSRWYYRLLLVKASFKALTPLKSEKEIMEIVKHYETGGDKRQLPYAYFYAGCTMNLLNDAPQALGLLQKALDVLPKDDIAMKSKIYNNCGHLYKNQNLNDQAVEMFKNSLRLDEAMKDTIKMIYNYRDLGQGYRAKGDNDSCLMTLKKGLELARIAKNNNAEKEILPQIAAYYVSVNKFIEAEKYIQTDLKIYNDYDRYVILTILIKIYMNTDRQDEALKYCYEVIENGNIFNKKTVSMYMAKVFFLHGNNKLGERYINLFNLYSDSVDNITATNSVAQMKASYDYSLRENENIKLKAENTKKTMMIYTSIIILTILIGAFSISYKKYKREKKLKEEILERLKKDSYEHSEEYIENNEEKIKLLDSKLIDSKGLHEIEIEDINTEKSYLIKTNEIVRQRISQRQLLTEQIERSASYRLITERLKNNKCILDSEWDTIDAELGGFLESFKTSLYSVCRISRQEYHVCFLIRLNFNVKEISILLSCSGSAISKSRKRLQEKFFADNGSAKDFDKFVKTL